MLLGQAVTQTPAIFGLLVSFILIFKKFDPIPGPGAAAIALLASGICTGLGGIGPGIGEGIAASGGVKWVAQETSRMPDRSHPHDAGRQAVAESTAIYSMVIAWF